MSKWLLLILLIPSIFASDYTLDGSHWLNRGQSASLEDLSFTVYPTSGDPAERVVLRIGESDRIIIKFSECQEYKQRYKFCFTNTQFNPESEQGTVDYEKDVYYSQVRIETYYIPDEVLAGAFITRTFSSNQPIVGETIKVEVTISNANEETGMYGLSYTELVPTDADVLLLSDAWNEHTLTWSGNLLAGEDVNLSYTLKPLVPKNISITGKLRSDTISVDKVSVLTPKSSGFISMNATGGAKTLVGTTHDAIFMLENEIDEDVEVNLLLEVPSGILFTGGNPQYERSIGTTMHYSVKARLPKGEKLTWTAKLRIDEQGSFDVKYKIIASAGSQDEILEGVFPYEIPYLPLTLQIEQISDYFQVGKPVPLSIILRNRDRTATFLDVAINLETQGKTVGLERAKLDGITPDSDVQIVLVNLTFLEEKMQLYKVNVTYRKGSEKLSVAKELQFYPEPTKPTSELNTTLESTPQETIPENVLENQSSAILEKNEPIVATVSVQERSASSIFLIVLVAAAVIGGIAFVALKKKDQEL